MKTDKLGVVLLATDKEPELGCICVRMGLQIWSGQFDKPHHNQHLYFTSNAVIKAGDCYYSSFHNKVLTCVNEAHAKGLSLLDSKELGQKIEATTDASLCIDTGNKFKDEQGNVVAHDLNFLPKIPTDYIQEYIKSYNEGNVLTEVVVEINFGRNEQPFIKTTPDNYVVISKERDNIDIKREASIQSVSLGYDGSKFKETFIEGFIACSKYLKNKEKMYSREIIHKLFQAGKEWDTYKKDDPRYYMEADEVLDEVVKTFKEETMYGTEEVHNLLMRAWITGQSKPECHYSVREDWIKENLK